MFQVLTTCELRDGRTLSEGQALLTVSEVKGDVITGWFRPEWDWDTDLARALVLGTPCAYEGLPENDPAWGDNENGEWTNPRNCECATCLIAEFPYDCDEYGEPAFVTITVPETKATRGDCLVVSGLFTSERLRGSADRHGVTAGGSSTTYCGSVSWDEWKAVEATEHTKWWLRTTEVE